MSKDTLTTAIAALYALRASKETWIGGNQLERVDTALSELEAIERVQTQSAPDAMPRPDWAYTGAATVETRGGGVMGIRFEELGNQGRPPDGLHEVTLTLTLRPRDAAGEREVTP